MEASAIKDFSDDELQAWIAMCKKDLLKAADSENNSEWHEACFCALALLAQEKNRRASARLR